jgi:hypothetical protein
MMKPSVYLSRCLLIAASLLVIPSAAGHAGQTLAAEGQMCGTIAGIPCAGKNGWCEFKAGTCNVSDNAGTCVKASPYCIKIYKPVCGCDGKTYGNDCTRRAARVQKSHDGPC